jgi:response regulator RpfG family c-di-GMP phosphodiesterase/DNA-binding NarL/FixJ family response regulator
MNQPSTHTIKRTEFLVVTKNAELLSVSKDVAVYFSFRAEFNEGLEAIDTAMGQGSSPLMILLSLEDAKGLEEKKSTLKALAELFPRSQIVVAVKDGEKAETCAALKSAGAQYLISMAEATKTAKLFYLSALLIQGTYIPVPVNDFFPSTQLNFNAFQKLQLNQKFLPVIFSGFNFSDKKYRKLESSKQIYVRREDLGEYKKYIEIYHDRTGSALKKRCRALLMSLMGTYIDITLLLSMEVGAFSQNLVAEKIELYKKLAEELALFLKDCPDVWNVIAQALDFKFCRLERGPYVLAYALVLALKAEIGSPQDIIMTALLADVGLLQLPPECYKDLHKNGEEKLAPELAESFKNHPMSSLNLALLRELPLSDEQKSIIVCTHERHDRTGFPNQVPPEKIPVEAKLLYFSEVMDRRVRAQLEEGKVTHDFIRRQVWEEEKVALNRFNDEFLDKIEKVLIA